MDRDLQILGTPPSLASLHRIVEALPPIAAPIWRDLSGEVAWKWVLGDPMEGLSVPLSRKPSSLSPVQLPHRVLHPDTPYWYETTLQLAGPSILHVSADDGAQVWANDQRIPANEGSYFSVVPDTTGKVALTVRVLNKAVYGGLNRIVVTDAAAYHRWQKETGERTRLLKLVKKLHRQPDAGADTIRAVEAAVSATGDRAVAYEKAAAHLARFPETRFGPLLQDATADRVTLLWETDYPCRPTLEYSEGYGTWHSVPVQTVAYTDGTLHTARLTGLKPATGYRYRYHNTPRGATTSRTFRTLPAADDTSPVTFTVWADSQMGWPTFRQNVAAMRQAAPTAAFTVGVGDLVENAFAVQPWQEFFEILTPLAGEVPAFLVPGNHDYDGCFEDLRPEYLKRYLHASPQPEYFAWTAGNARFIALDPNPYFPTSIPADSPTYRWLMRELESPEWKAARWHFIFIHQPPYAQGWAEYHGDDAIRTLLEPLYEKYGIDFVISGHAHDYERLTKTFGRQQVHFVIVGGAGGGLEDEAMSEYPKMDKIIRRHHFGVFQIAGDRVTFDAIATDLRTIDHLNAVK